MDAAEGSPIKCEVCPALLSEGLDLCMRARAMDAVDRRQAALSVSSDPEGWQRHGTFDRYVEMHNEECPDRPISTRSATVALWEEDAYQTALADWERRAREHLLTGCRNRETATVLGMPKRK